MNAKLKDKLEQVIDLLDQIDDMLGNDIVLKNGDACDEFSFFGLAAMIDDYLKKSLDKSNEV